MPELNTKSAYVALSNMDDYARMADIDPIGPRRVLEQFIIDAENAITAAYEQGRKDAVPTWISVNDRLPESGTYTCSGHGGTRFICFLQKGEWWRNTGSKRVDGITHWMPLPAAPKQEK